MRTFGIGKQKLAAEQRIVFAFENRPAELQEWIVRIQALCIIKLSACIHPHLQT